MENVWDRLKALKGRSWIEVKDILSKVSKNKIRPPEIFYETYKVHSETLPESDRGIYSVYLKDEPFYLERCKLCSRLVKPAVADLHYDLHHKRPSNTVKRSFLSPNKKKHYKKGNKSASEDDSESAVSSETPSPALDFHDSQLSNSGDGLSREDTIIDIISVEEIPSEDSKPPTPGPQDLYEEFSIPYTEVTVNDTPSILTSSADALNSSKIPFSNTKPFSKLKITTNKDANQKTSGTTSLLEAHLLSNTKYNANSLTFKNSNLKFNSLFSKTGNQNTLNENNDQSNLKSEDQCDQQMWKGSTSVLQQQSNSVKNETKISIPISVLPQNVKIIGTLKKPILLKNNAQFENLNDKGNLNTLSSPFNVLISTEDANELPEDKYDEKKDKDKKPKRLKGKNRWSKLTEYDPDKHCGVIVEDNKRCLRSLTCKTHLISSRRAVEGRSKEFDKLLADHRASKESLKDHERNHNRILSEPIINIPILKTEKLSGNMIKISSSGNNSEIIKIRVPNALTNSDNSRNNTNFQRAQNGNSTLKVDGKSVPRKLVYSVKLPNSCNAKFSDTPNKHNQSAQASKIEPKSHDSDYKISFVCSDMLYKIGGMLSFDRSRQAIRRCMGPLISKNTNHKPPKQQNHINRKITDFLQPVKYYNNPPIKLNVIKDNGKSNENVLGPVKSENIADLKNDLMIKANEELERMKCVLNKSSKLFKNLTTVENEIRKLKQSKKLKRKAANYIRNGNSKICKRESMSDENYNFNSLLTLDKSLVQRVVNGEVKQLTVTDSEGLYGLNAMTFANLSSSSTCDEQTVKKEFLHSGANENFSHLMDTVSYNVFLNNTGNGNHNPDMYGDKNNVAELLQTFTDFEDEIRNDVNGCVSGDAQAQDLTEIQPFLNSNNALINFINAAAVNSNENVDRSAVEFKIIDCNIPNFDESMIKNYSLLEEYCKNITSDELLINDKTGLEFLDSTNTVINDDDKIKNEVIVVNEGLFAHEPNNVNGTVNNEYINSLPLDAQFINSYLSSVSTGSTNHNQSGNEIDFNGCAKFDNTQVGTQNPIITSKCNQDALYEEILTLNKHYQDNSAVKLEKPPTPNPVYSEAENEEVLKWLF